VTEEQLHDKATRGETLSAEESARLQEWYARLDREEVATLDKAFPSTSVAEVHTQIEAALAQLATVTQHIQALTAENAALRREIVSLQAQLAQRPTPQPA
jgi:hypothetical protein